MTQYDYLKTKIDHLVDDYATKRNKARRSAHFTRVAVIILGATTTVLVGLREFDILSAQTQWLGIAALILSAMATVTSAWEGFANYAWRWVHYRMMLVQFYMLRDRIDYAALDTDALDDDACDAFFAEMMTILSEANSQWQDKRASAINSG